MRIATWNVNSIRTRQEQLLAWLARAAPDVLCMQETKVEDERFPVELLEEAGYRSAFFGEKSYNGVSISARFGLAIEDVKKNLDGDDATSHRRVIAATIEGVRVMSVYAPNGNTVGSDHWSFKLAWFERLRAELDAHYSADQEVLLVGDFNVAPQPIDVHDPAGWEKTVLFHPDARAALEKTMDFGLIDLLRQHHPEPGIFTWWDYRLGMYKRNRGLRIDLALGTHRLAARVRDVTIDKRPRELNRPSDHVPVIVEIA